MPAAVMSDSPPPPAKRTAALAFIFITILIDVLAFGLIIPVLPHLVEELSGGTTSTAAYWVGVFATTFALIQFVTSPIQGALADRFGRRPVILLSCLGLGLDFAFMALAPSLAWLFVGRIISAVTSASFTTANAYIADITEPSKRAQSYGVLGAAFGLGFVIGPLLGGVLGDIGVRLPFWFAAGLATCNFVYGWLVLPESLPPARRSRRFDWSHANPLGALELLKRYPQVFGLAVVVFLTNMAHYVYPSVFVLYADYRYGWGKKEVGYVLATVGALSIVVNVALVGAFVRKLGERRSLLIGLACGSAGFFVFAAATRGWIWLLGLPLSAIWGIAAPSTQALITRQVGPEVQGRIQGALMSLVSMAGIVGPPIFAGSFGYFVDDATPLHLPGVPFLIAGLILLAGVAVGARASASAPPLPEAVARDPAEPG